MNSHFGHAKTQLQVVGNGLGYKQCKLEHTDDLQKGIVL
jgi:hypothetical protein